MQTHKEIEVKVPRQVLYIRLSIIKFY